MASKIIKNAKRDMNFPVYLYDRTAYLILTIFYQDVKKMQIIL